MNESLPIDAILPEVKRVLEQVPTLILTAPPGSGKTTRVPPALLDSVDGKILLLQPRRAAARLVARRMAAERSERVGDGVGYHVRFDRNCGPNTRIEVMTEGICLRKLQSDPFLEGVSVVLLDEFHERSVQADMTLALLREIQQDVRPELKLIILSATLDPKPLLDYFEGDAKHLHSEGRTFPVAMHYRPVPSQGELLDHLVDELRKLTSGALSGHILVFLPGVREIHRCIDALEGTVSIPMFPLYGKLKAAEQDAALSPSRTPKLVLSTNLAETSVTLPGVEWVVDSGLHRVATHHEGFTQLRTEWISQDSAEQRAGRAGRTEAGQAIRLWNAFTHQRLAAVRTPEIERTDLCSPVLQIYAWGSHPNNFGWLSPPPARALARALDALQQIGAVHDDKLTAIGRRLATLPIHPRWGRVLLEAVSRGVLSHAVALTVLLTEDNPFSRQGLNIEDAIPHVVAGDCPRRHRSAYNQLSRALSGEPSTADRHSPTELANSFMAGFPERIGQLRPDRQRVLLASGIEAQFPPKQSGSTPFLLALDLHQTERGTTRISQWLPLNPEQLPRQSSTRHEFIEGRVRAVREERIGAIVLKSHNTQVDPSTASELLLEAATKNPKRALKPGGKAQRLLQRIRFLARTQSCPITAWSDLLPNLCLGRTSFKELQSLDLHQELMQALPWATQQTLKREVPDQFKLPSGSHARLEYPEDGPPILTARIQQVFGLTQTPQIGGDPIMVHLTAPNNRPQQQTRDLESFWRESYPIIRKELRGRYPKHAWPEEPTAADAQDRPQRNKG